MLWGRFRHSQVNRRLGSIFGKSSIGELISDELSLEMRRPGNGGAPWVVKAGIGGHPGGAETPP